MRRERRELEHEDQVRQALEVDQGLQEAVEEWNTRLRAAMLSLRAPLKVRGVMAAVWHRYELRNSLLCVYVLVLMT